MSEQEFDKSEQATPHKLEEARKQGQVSKSADLNAVVVLTGFVVVFAGTVTAIGGSLVTASRRLLSSAGQLRFDQDTFGPWLLSVVDPVVIALSPLLIALMVCAVSANLLQTGPVLSAFPVKPDFTRLNPANGLKRIFNLRTPFELFKLVLKLGLLAVFLYWGYRHLMTDLSAWAVLPAQAAPALVRHLFAVTASVLLGIFALVALIDLAFSKREFMRRMRMSKRELKEEYRRREGDPAIRAKRRRLHAELRSRAGALRKVKDADVVVVNPVHIAVALRYRPGETTAPIVLAMGAGAMAARIRDRARRHAVPVVHKRELARLLFKSCRLGDVIPFACYREVAAIYRRLAAVPGSRVVLA